MSYDDLFVDGHLDLDPTVIGKKYFSFYLQRDNLIFQAGGYIGLIPINDRVILDVRPRVPVRNLDRLIQVTNEGASTLPHLREYPTLGTPTPSLMDVFTRQLLAGLEAVEAEGLHKEYQLTTADTSFPKGRLMMAPTMQRHLSRDRRHIVTASWFEHSSNTPPNRCLKYAIWLLQRNVTDR